MLRAIVARNRDCVIQRPSFRCTGYVLQGGSLWLAFHICWVSSDGSHDDQSLDRFWFRFSGAALWFRDQIDDTRSVLSTSAEDSVWIQWMYFYVRV